MKALTGLIITEISKTDDPNVIFRGNSITIKVIDRYMKIVAEDYLKKNLAPLILGICEISEALELDSCKVTEETAIKNSVLMATVIGRFWQVLQNSIDSFPKEIVQLFSIMRITALEKFPQAPDVKYGAVSGFLFLRLIGPSILSPQKRGIISLVPNTIQIKNLTLAAKILQSLANLSASVPQNGPLSHLAKFLKAERNNMKNYLDNISLITAEQQSSIALTGSTIILAENVKAMFGYCVKLIPALKLEAHDEAVANLIQVTECIQNGSHSGDENLLTDLKISRHTSIFSATSASPGSDLSADASSATAKSLPKGLADAIQSQKTPNRFFNLLARSRSKTLLDAPKDRT